MLLNDVISGGQVCQILCEQNRISIPEDERNAVFEGRMSAYQFMMNRIDHLDITPAQLALDPYSGSVVVTEEVIQAMTEYNDLAPLHNPANLIGVAACQKLMPNTLMVGVFDTAFNQTMEPQRPISTACLTATMRSIRSADTDFTASATSMCLREPRSFIGTGSKACEKPLYATLGNGASISAVKYW